MIMIQKAMRVVLQLISVLYHMIPYMWLMLEIQGVSYHIMVSYIISYYDGY